jgi:hypothetical protein
LTDNQRAAAINLLRRMDSEPRCTLMHAPDFLGYQDAIQMAKDHSDIVQRSAIEKDRYEL